MGSSSTLTLIKGTLKLMAWTKVKMPVALAAVLLFAVCTASVMVEQLMHPATDHTAEALTQGIFVTSYGVYQWTNASAIGELTFRNNKLRSVTLGTSQPPSPGAI